MPRPLSRRYLSRSVAVWALCRHSAGLPPAGLWRPMRTTPRPRWGGAGGGWVKHPPHLYDTIALHINTHGKTGKNDQKMQLAPHLHNKTAIFIVLRRFTPFLQVFNLKELYIVCNSKKNRRKPQHIVGKIKKEFFGHIKAKKAGKNSKGHDSAANSPKMPHSPKSAIAPLYI